MKMYITVLMLVMVTSGSAFAQSESRVPTPTPTPTPASAPETSGIIQGVTGEQAAPTTNPNDVPETTLGETQEAAQGSATVNSIPAPTPITAGSSICNSCDPQPLYSVPMSDYSTVQTAQCDCTGMLMSYSSGYNQPAMNLWSGYSKEESIRYAPASVSGAGCCYGGFWHRPMQRAGRFGFRRGGF